MSRRLVVSQRVAAFRGVRRGARVQSRRQSGREIAALVAWLRRVRILVQATARHLPVAKRIALPHQVALLGVGNHLTACLADEPTLSSVNFPWRLTGQIAARHTHRLLHLQSTRAVISRRRARFNSLHCR